MEELYPIRDGKRSEDASRIGGHDGTVKLGFELEGKIISIPKLLPGKIVDERTIKSAKYSSVLASIQEVGIIEPPVVYPLRNGTTRHVAEDLQGHDDASYLLLDGHVRIEALKAMGETEVFCLIATDDEAYTYNHKVSRLQPLQEHFMIMKALERGVSEERIARALKVDVHLIRKKRDMVRDICPEAVDLLKNSGVPAETLRHLRSVKPARQIEIAEMMSMVGNYGSAYCQALVAATPKELLTGIKQKTKVYLSSEDIARMQREMETLQCDLQTYEDTYGQNFLNLVIVRGYLSRLLGNSRVVRFLSNNHADLLNTLQKIVESTSLE